MSPLLKYWPLADIARLRHTRIFWAKPEARQALLRHWNLEQHPYRERFSRSEEVVCRVLESSLPDEQLDEVLRQEGMSLRQVVREIPPIMPCLGSIFNRQV